MKIFLANEDMSFMDVNILANENMSFIAGKYVLSNLLLFGNHIERALLESISRGSEGEIIEHPLW